jgi:hypothetical protein
MADLQIKATGKAWRIGDFADNFGDWAELVEWCASTPDMACSMHVKARDDKGVLFQVEGLETASAYAEMNQWIVWNTFNFEVLSDDNYQAKYGGRK